MDQVEAKAHTISEAAHQVISAKVSLAGDVKEAVIDKTVAGVEGVKEILAGTYLTRVRYFSSDLASAMTVSCFNCNIFLDFKENQTF